ncbi:hypothetical protein [Paenibacillus rhizoplanae]|uniref:Uncharacterized protein n=1 Tax=Paenibacillus rhizoplanae TaxID=1917181 RepID=A0ABW5F424_9BACL
MSKPIHLYQLDINPAAERHLLSLTQRHLKLAVEHASEQIIHDISALLASYDEQTLVMAKDSARCGDCAPSRALGVERGSVIVHSATCKSCCCLKPAIMESRSARIASISLVMSVRRSRVVWR